MRRRPRFLISFVAAALLLVGETGFCENPKVNLLEQKKGELISLYEMLNAKRIQAENIRKQLESHMEELAGEIASETKNRGIKTYKQASKVPRIEFNLRLLQRLYLYTAGLSGKIAYLENAENELAYWHMLTDDDLKIFQTMSDMDINKLLAEVSGVLETHRPESGAKLIDIRDSVARTPEEIWKDVLEFGKSH